MCEVKDGVARRRFVLGGLAASTALAGGVALPRSASAQSIICSYAGTSSTFPVDDASSYMMQIVTAITRVIGFNIRIQMGEIAGGNAMALMYPYGGYGQPVPSIFYNPYFMDELEYEGGEGAVISVMAHEVGHHANADTTWYGRYRHPWDREFGADWVSGLFMGLIGAPLGEAQSALRVMIRMFGPFNGSMEHPHAIQRLDAVTAGWIAGGGTPARF